MFQKDNSQFVILVVDDSADTVSMLNDGLEQEGFSVLVALSGLQAISICKQIVPDVILLDAMMPELDGFETCKKIKQLPNLDNVPVIFMTGLDSQDTVKSSFDSGAVDYIQKPIRFVELIARINNHINKAKQINSSRKLLDNVGHSAIAVNSDGKIIWNTPLAYDLLLQAGFNKIRLVNELSLQLKDYIQKQDFNHPLALGAESKIMLRFEQLQDEAYLFTLIKAKQKTNEIDELAKIFNLTKREAEVLYWTAQGKSNKDLAMILDISPRTVNKHLESIFEKMLVENRTCAANMAIKELNKLN